MQKEVWYRTVFDLNDNHLRYHSSDLRPYYNRMMTFTCIEWKL